MAYRHNYVKKKKYYNEQKKSYNKLNQTSVK